MIELFHQVENLKVKVGELEYPDWENTPILFSGDIDHNGAEGTWKRFWIFKDDLPDAYIEDFLTWTGIWVDGYRPLTTHDCSGKTIISPIEIINAGKDYTLVIQRFSTDI